MTYAIQVKGSAEKALNKLPEAMRDRVDAEIDALADDPRPPGAKALKGPFRGLWRVQVGDYRVIYDVDDSAHVVIIAAVGHRSKVYR